MKKLRAASAIIASVMAIGTAGVAATPLPAKELVIAVPGFADFMAVDGDSVWVTNRGRVERWSRKGKLAEVAMKHPCGAMAIAGGSLWVADCEDKTLVRIDTRTAKIVATIPTGIAHPDGELNVVFGAGSIWVASDVKGIVARVDPASDKIIASVPVSADASYLAFGFAAVWVVSSAQRTVQKIDPATNAVVKTTALGNQPGFLAAGEGAVWVQEQLDGALARIDPATGEVSGRVKIDETLKYGDIDTGGGKIWLRTTAGQSFVVVDPKTLAVRGRIGAAAGSGALRYTARGIWTSAHDVHSISWWANPRTIGR